MGDRSPVRGGPLPDGHPERGTKETVPAGLGFRAHVPATASAVRTHTVRKTPRSPGVGRNTPRQAADLPKNGSRPPAANAGTGDTPVVTKAKDQEEAFTFAILLGLTASSARLRDRCAESVEEHARGLSKAQIARSKHEAARCVSRTTLPTDSCSKHGVMHVFAVDPHTASDIVLRGACASLEEYDLVRGLAAFVMLKAVGHRLTEQAGQMYFDAIEAKVSSDISRGPIGARHSARFEAAKTLPKRRRRAVLAEQQREMDRDYEEAFRTLDKAVELELAMRTAAALRSPAGLNRRATAHLN